MTRLRLSAALALACLILASCGGGATSPYGAGGGVGGGGGMGGGVGSGGGGSTSNAITVGNNFFEPAQTTVPVGTTVTWTWSAGDVAHNVTFDNGGPASPTQSSGTFTFTFTVPGSYNYHCTIHGLSMAGTVVVQ